jgi:ABC-type nitrate/sulfonate/bicarbonate transport system permease component
MMAIARTRIKTVDRAIAAGIALAILTAWEISSRNGWISSLVFPAPTKILADFPILWRQGLLENITLTLARFAGGAVIGCVPGIIFGLCIGWSPRLRRIADPFVAAFHPIPKIVLFPLFIVIFGMSELSKLAAVGLTVFFPCFINAAAAARDIPPLYFELLPGSLPTVLSGVRIAMNLGLLVTIAIEFTVTTRGIGSIIWLAWQTMRIEDLYAGVMICSVIGVTINASLHALLRRVAPWQVRN